MSFIALLDNAIQDYSWGSRTDIPELLGREPGDTPQAELWMGAHPKAPSLIPAQKQTLLELIQEDPVAVLGSVAAETDGGRLPFLFKVLAAAQPLSIQAHPTKKQALEGYSEENRRGIPLTAPHRNYADDNHKPEIICALTPFWALSGFRAAGDIRRLLEEFGVPDLDRAGALERDDLETFYRDMMQLPAATKDAAVTTLVESARSLQGKRSEADWILRTADICKGDFGLISILVLNLVKLDPGEALYQDAGLLHAYLSGLGMELMANSDNVLRGGLTPKHVDLPELMKVLQFTSAKPMPLLPEEVSESEQVYRTPSHEFVLSRVEVDDRHGYSGLQDRSIEIWIVIQGHGTVADAREGLTFRQGDSFVVPASVDVYTIKGTATLFKATVPL